LLRYPDSLVVELQGVQHKKVATLKQQNISHPGH